MSDREDPDTCAMPSQGETLAQYVPRWFETRYANRSSGTQNSIRSLLENHVLPLLGPLTLEEITPAVIAGFDQQVARIRTTKGKRLAPNSVLHITRLPRQILRDALGAFAAGKLGKPSTARYLRPPKEDHDTPILCAGGLQALVDVAPKAWEPYLVFRICSGLSGPDIHALEWPQVNVGAPSASPAAARGAPMANLNEGMRWALSEQAKLNDRRKSQYVFPDRNGRALTEEAFTDVFHRALAQLGLPLYGTEQLQIETAYCWLGSGRSATYVAGYTRMPFEKVKRYLQAIKPPAVEKTPEAIEWLSGLFAFGPVVLRQWFNGAGRNQQLQRWLDAAESGRKLPAWKLARVAAVGLRAAPPNDGADTPEVPQTPRDLQWYAAFKDFSAVWAHRQDDQISETHPYRNWALKQRAAFEHEKLPLWRMQLLWSIGFPFLATRTSEGSTNVDHAHAAVAFFKENGHWCVTQSAAGPALEKWLKIICATGGKQGLIRVPQHVDLAKDLALANAILLEGIPGFDYRVPDKRRLNLAHGLTHNGYRPSESCPSRSDRRDEMVSRIRAAIDLAHCPIVLPEEMRYVIGDTPVALRLRAWEPEACINLQEESPPGMRMQRWVTGRLIGPAQFFPPAAALSPSQYRGLVWSPDFSYLAAEWHGPHGRFTVDIDVPLQDQQNLETWWIEHSGLECWLESHRSQALSACTARTSSFNANMRLLQDFLPHPQGVWVRFNDTPRKIYAFLEHQKLIRDQGNLKRSDALRLAEMGFLFGKGRAPAAVVFGCHILFGRGPVPKEERHQYNSDRLDALLGVRGLGNDLSNQRARVAARLCGGSA